MSTVASAKSKKIKVEDLQDSRYIVRVADPASGLLKYTEAEFLKCWYSTKSEGVQEGTALLLEPTPDFYSQEGEGEVKIEVEKRITISLTPHTSLLMPLA